MSTQPPSLTRNDARALPWVRAMLMALVIGLPIGLDGPGQFTEEEVLATSDQGSTMTWRLTNQGWQNIAPLLPRTPVELNRWTQLHPLTWSAGVLLSVSAMLVWSSNEWDLERLWGGSETSDPQTAGSHSS